MTRTALIGLDWGTTALRAYRIGADGTVLERRDSQAGILKVTDGDFEAALGREAGDWLEAAPDAPVLASGMITSRQGWRETPYLGCPSDGAALAGALTPHAMRGGRHVHFVTGLLLDGDGPMPDVMRGEETQILGCLEAETGDGVFVLPGTHSKWALVEAGRIRWFATFMTGEVFAALKDHTILGRLMEGDGGDVRGFARGLETGLATDAAAGGLLRRLFSARTLGLTGALPGSALADYLSGLVIASEVREGLLCATGRTPVERVTLVGRGALAGRYGQAFAAAGIGTTTAPEDAVARGLHRIATAAGLIA